MMLSNALRASLHKCTFALFLAALFFSCTSDPNQFSDPELVAISDLQDKRKTDSLLLYLTSQQLTHRRAAALALASVQDSAASRTLGNALLEDTDEEVRKYSAFALGQTKGTEAVNSLIPALEDKSPVVVREVLEALGKSVTAVDLAVISRYKPADSITSDGFAWGIYRIGLRGLADSVIVDRAKKLLASENSYGTRLAAANFFSRGRFTRKGFDEELIQAATMDKNADVRMAAANALSKVESTLAQQAIEKILTSEKDYRVKVNAVRSAGRLKLTDIAFRALEDESQAVQVAASEVIVTLDNVDQVKLNTALKTSRSPRVVANLYGVLLKTSDEDILGKIIAEYETSTSYTRSHLLSAISSVKEKDIVKAIEFLSSQLLQSKEFVIKSSSSQALATINRNNTLSKDQKGAFADIYQKAIADGDRAVVAIVCSALSSDKLNYKEVITDLDFLKKAKAKLKLPEDYEALQPLEEALAYFEGRPKPAAPENKFNHPIDWTLVRKIPADQKVLIKTSKGDIVIKLLVEEAPGSVANFYDLVSKKYFDQKYIHRVVPNFVIQAGCNRGDGYGGEDYSIRSEFSMRRYTTGSVGMASAGKDTEGTQWFITHSPTPHLDGGYTIFAETLSGMEVVDNIEVGDQIVSASLIK